MGKLGILVYLHSVLLLGVLAGAEPKVGGGPTAPRYPDHSKLLRVIAADGTERPVGTAADWKLRREHVLLGMQEVMGEFRLQGPAAAGKRAVDFSVVGEADAGTYLRRLISYAADGVGGDRVPAFLLIPKKRAGRVPAILCLHQTTPRGKAEPAGLAGREDLQIARHLAERGYVTLAPDYPNFGDHVFDTYGRGYRSGSMKAIEDNVRAVDLLSSLPEVDPERIGCIGHSLGGHNTLFTAVFDERIRVMVSNCGFTAFGSYYRGDLTGWSSKTYLPRIPSYGGWRNLPFDFHEVVACLAPRPFLAIAPLSDSNFEVKGVREVMESAAGVYRLLGAGEKLVLHTPDCGHDFPPAAREQAYQWFDRWLKR